MPRTLSSIAVGYRFGCFTVVEKTNQRKNGYIVWRCQCVCGTVVEMDTRKIQRAAVLDCGCGRSRQIIAVDLSGMMIGEYLVLRKADDQIGKPVSWVCECSCGNVVEVSQELLLHPNGSLHCDNPVHQYDHEFLGCRIGKLTVLSYAGKKKGKHMWRCRCDCGKLTYASSYQLRNGRKKSCGCMRKETVNEHFGFQQKTSVSKLTSVLSGKLNKKNKTGKVGVYQNQNGRYVAQITFQGVTRYLGSFVRLEDAVKVREDEEQRLFGQMLKAEKGEGH